MNSALLYLTTSILFLANYFMPASPAAMKYAVTPADYVVFNFDTTNAQYLGDSGFLVLAYAQNAFEVRASKLAYRQSGDFKVKATAMEIKKDHDCIANSLQMLLAKRGYGLPQPTCELQAKYKYLNSYMGQEFNARYANGNAADATGDITFYTSFLQSTKDKELKQFASNALTVLKTDKSSMDSLIVHINTPHKSSW